MIAVSILAAETHNSPPAGGGVAAFRGLDRGSDAPEERATTEWACPVAAWVWEYSPLENSSSLGPRSHERGLFESQ